MTKIILVAALSLPLAIVTANANPKDDEFEKIAKDYTENYLSSHPEFATELGDHRFDGVLTDYSQETRARMLANAKQVREARKRTSSTLREFILKRRSNKSRARSI
jgi:hypothetical protein